MVVSVSRVASGSNFANCNNNGNANYNNASNANNYVRPRFNKLQLMLKSFYKECNLTEVA